MQTVASTAAPSTRCPACTPATRSLSRTPDRIWHTSLFASRIQDNTRWFLSRFRTMSASTKPSPRCLKRGNPAQSQGDSAVYIISCFGIFRLTKHCATCEHRINAATHAPSTGNALISRCAAHLRRFRFYFLGCVAGAPSPAAKAQRPTLNSPAPTSKPGHGEWYEGLAP